MATRTVSWQIEYLEEHTYRALVTRGSNPMTTIWGAARPLYKTLREAAEQLREMLDNHNLSVHFVYRLRRRVEETECVLAEKLPIMRGSGIALSTGGYLTSDQEPQR